MAWPDNVSDGDTGLKTGSDAEASDVAATPLLLEPISQVNTKHICTLISCFIAVLQEVTKVCLFIMVCFLSGFMLFV